MGAFSVEVDDWWSESRVGFIQNGKALKIVESSVGG